MRSRGRAWVLLPLTLVLSLLVYNNCSNVEQGQDTQIDHGAHKAPGKF
jgi:hypothetical protein